VRIPVGCGKRGKGDSSHKNGAMEKGTSLRSE
jgi:hypothetical protein